MSKVAGEFSGRMYDPARIGIRIERRSLAQVQIEANKLETVARHIARFGDDEANNLMLRRLRQIANGLMAPTRYDLQFYAHEIRECERYTALGFPDGQPGSLDEAYELWNNAHTATLEEYGVTNERIEPYHPDAQAMMFKAGDF